MDAKRGKAGGFENCGRVRRKAILEMKRKMSLEIVMMKMMKCLKVTDWKIAL